MDDADKRIGTNLAQLRGEMSQAALAAAMRARGWKWSQPTVAAIEKGERAVKLAEAEALLDVLGMDRLEELTTRPLESIWWARKAALENAHDRLIGSTAGFLNARLALAEISDALEFAGEEIPEEAEAGDWIRLSVKEVTELAHPTPPRLPAASSGRFVKILHESDYASYASRARERWGKGERSDGAPADAAE